MFEVSNTTIKLTRGDSAFCQVIIKRGDSTYTPQEGDTIKFVVKRNLMTTLKSAYVDVSPLITKLIPNDTLVLYLEPADTKRLPFGDYVYDMEITFEDGNVDTFINNAPFRLLPEVD